jgi:hypothetical protein
VTPHGALAGRLLFSLAAAMTTRGLEEAANDRQHHRLRLRVRRAGGLGVPRGRPSLRGQARGMTSPEAGVGIGDRASREAARSPDASPCRGRLTSPTTEQLARDVPERSEDVARPVTSAAHAGSSRRDSFAGAAGGLAWAGGRGGIVQTLEPRASLPPMIGRLRGYVSNDWKNLPARLPRLGSRERDLESPVRISDSVAQTKFESR